MNAKAKEIIDLYKSGYLINDIKQQVGCGRSTIYNVLKECEIEPRRIYPGKKSRFSDSEIKEMHDMYIGGMVPREIGELFGVSKEAILYYFHTRGYSIKNKSEQNRKYHVDENFFDSIDTEEKAYYLGLLYADGTNYMKKNSIQIGLQERDKDILEKFRASLNTEKPLHKIKTKYPGGQDIFKLEIVSEHMCNVLNDIGMVPNKSLVLEFPNCIPNDLIRHCIRGYFDGDGYISRGHDYTVEIMGTEMFCLKVQEILKDNGIFSKIYNTTLHKETTTRRLYVGTKDNVKKFLEYIYKDATVYIDRKFQTAVDKYGYTNNSLSI